MKNKYKYGIAVAIIAAAGTIISALMSQSIHIKMLPHQIHQT